MILKDYFVMDSDHFEELCDKLTDEMGLRTPLPHITSEKIVSPLVESMGSDKLFVLQEIKRGLVAKRDDLMTASKNSVLDMEYIRLKYDFHKRRGGRPYYIDGLERRLCSVQKRFKSITRRLTEVRKELQRINSRIRAVNKKKSNKESL